jgi:hypothetical protein
MKKYGDTNFGFSFWYPATWNVSFADKLTPSLVGDVSARRLQVAPTNGSYGFIVEEVTTSNSVMTQPIQNLREGCRLVYYFDATNRDWVQNTSGCAHLATDLHPADVHVYTMGGLAMLPGIPMQTIVPLSAHNFISVLYFTNDAAHPRMDQTLLAKTIEAVDLSIANPVSADEQTAMIQAEKKAYTGQ